MKSLEEEIEELERLDERRIESATMRDQGRKALRADLTWLDKNGSNDALVIKALCDREEGPPPELVRKLENLPPDEILSETEEISILRAARSMQALAAAPDSAFSPALLVFYYQIIRELYTADAPDWRIGGARAMAGGNASAYVTGECIRALLGFSRSLENTSAFVNELRLLRRRKKHLESQSIPPLWCKVELCRLDRDFYTSVVRLLDNIALKLDLPEDKGIDELLPLRPESVGHFIEKSPKRIARAVGKTAETFENVIKGIERFRQRERRAARKEQRESQRPATLEAGGFSQGSLQKRYERSETGHTIALGALKQGLDSAQAAAALFRDTSSNDDEALEKLAAMLGSVAKAVQRLLHPARTYLSTVLDRELTAASSEARTHWDPREMAFAATSYGFAAGSFDDFRLRRAGICISAELSERGRVRSGSPFHVDAEGGHFEVLEAEVLRAFSQLLEHVEEIPVDNDLIKRMLLFFQDTRKACPGNPEIYGWFPEQVQEPAKPLRWVTAISALALDRMNRTLDARINQRVFQHFTVEKDEKLKSPPLRGLFYPDYGLRQRGIAPVCPGSWEDEESIALTLERMRTHVLGLSRREKPVPPLFSLILYGPPGTGKTTLVEALAKSAEAPIVRITPSDIVSSGADVVERRARAVFKALSLLTRAVILFDEFDPVLRRRNPDDLEPHTVFSFVTPGMLPKLKTLHESAKRRSVAYVLVTNLIGVLDGAAVRSGRFDRKLGVYPPDPLSREGRLLDEALAFQTKDKWPQDLEERVRFVVRSTGGAQMEALVGEGWFRRPEGTKLREASPFHYLTGGSALAKVERPEAEVKLQPPLSREAPAESDRAAEREYHQRAWLRNWEGKLTEAADSRGVQEAIRRPTESVPLIQRVQGEPQEAYLTWGAKGSKQSTPVRLYVIPEIGDEQPADSFPADPL